MRESDVLWAFTIAGMIGLVLGLRYRMPAIVAASGLVLVGGIAVAPLTGLPLWTALAAPFGALCALQSGYIAGLMLSCAMSSARATAPPRGAAAGVHQHLPLARPSAAAGT